MEWCKSECGKYRIESLTAATVHEALNVIRVAFCKDELECIATEVNINPVATEELLELCADTALDGVSVIAVEISTGKVVAVCFNKLQEAATGDTFFNVFAKERCTQPSSKALVQLMADLDSRWNMFEIYGVDCTLELMFLATLKEYRRQKLGYYLCKSSIELGRKLENGPVSHITLDDLGPKYFHMEPRKVITKAPKICHLLASAVGTQRIAKKLNFTVLFRIPYAGFFYNGKSYVERAGFDPYLEVIARWLRPI